MVNGLVKGYAIARISEEGKRVETLFFIDNDQVFDTVEQPWSTNFAGNFQPSNKSVDWVRENAEYIGNYVRP